MLLRFSLAMIFFCATVCSQAQTNTAALDSLSGFVISSIRSQREEKVFLTSNKRIYHVDESIWYRALVVNALSGKISSKSKILYVDLVNQDDKRVLQAVLNAGRQQTSGSFLISEAIPSGNYWLRAYTKRVAFADSLDCAVLSLYVYNPKLSASTAAPAVASTTTPIVDIFPESGTLMTATENLVGIHAHNENGNPLELRAYLTDNRSRDSIQVRTNQYGFGSFTFTPNRFKKYFLVTTFNGKLYRFPLPPFNFWGGQVAVRQTPDRALVIRTILEDSLEKSSHTTYLLGIRGDSLCYANIGHGSYETTVPTASLPDGIIRFFLYDYRFKLLGERNVYVRNPALNVTVSLDKAGYKAREKVLLTTAVKDLKGAPVPSSICITVVDSAIERQSEQVEKKELIHQLQCRNVDQWAAIHLQDISDEELDQMLLCQSQDLARSQVTQANRSLTVEDSFLTVKGQILTQKGAPVANQAFTLMSSAANAAFISDSTDRNGRFSILAPELLDSTALYLQVGGTHSLFRDAIVKLDTSAFPSFTTPLQLKYLVPLPDKQDLLHVFAGSDPFGLEGRDQLTPVVLKTTAKKPLDYDENDRISRNSKIVSPTMIHRTGSTFMENALRMVPGLQILQGYVVLGGLNGMGGPNAKAEPLVLMDGVEVPLPSPTPPNVSPVLQFFSELGANEVDFIEVFTGAEASLFGLRGGNGVIYIHSAKRVYDGDLTKANSGLFKIYAKGFAPEPVFDQPDFKLPEFANLKADLRSTLIWEGNVVSDVDGAVQTRFFANDVKGTYVVVVTGITVHGDLIYVRSKLNVH